MRLRLVLGTRDSQLALWQAQTVANLVRSTGHACDLKTIKSFGDEVTDRPLAEIGQSLAGKGVFTKALDDALLDKSIDLAVHSLKDVPTRLPEGLCIASILPREDPSDILVTRSDGAFLANPDYPATIATGSTRRQAQWQHRYANHQVVDLRGNLQTRLRKLYEGTWDGAIFAAAGLNRMGLRNESHLKLDWMLPAPGQGAIAVVCRTDDHPLRDVLAPLNDVPTATCVTAERMVLFTLEGGCSAPVAALAIRHNYDQFLLKAAVLAPDGTEQLTAESTGHDPLTLGKAVADKLLALGAGKLIAMAHPS